MPFPVTCPACGKSFSISDDVYDQKIKGRVVSVKCKQCQAAIRVDGTKGSSASKASPEAAPTAARAEPVRAEAAPAAAPAEAPKPAPMPEPAARVPASTTDAFTPPAAEAPVTATRSETARTATPNVSTVATQPVPVPAAAAEPEREPEREVNEPLLYAVDSPGGDRELTVEQIAAELTLGSLTGETLVWRDGMAEWLEVKKVPELAKHLRPAPATAQKRPAPAAAAFAPAAPQPAVSPPSAAAAPSAPEAAKGFRPRQPTLPMGAIPSAAASGRGAARDVAATAGAKQTGPAPTLATEGRSPAVGPRAGAATTGGRAITTPVVPRAAAPRSPAAGPQPRLASTDTLDDEEPTVLRSPEAMAALLNALPDEDPLRSRGAAAPAREERRLPPLSAAGSGKLPPFTTREATSLAPEPLPEFASAPPPPPPPPPAAARPAAASGATVSTFRESPDAKRAWFPEESDAGVSPTAPLVAPPAPFAPSPSAAPAARAASPAAPVASPAAPVASAASPAAPVASAASPAAPPVASAAPGAAPVARMAPVPLTPIPHPTPFPAPASFDEDVPFKPKRRVGLWITLLLLIAVGLAAGYFFFARKAPPVPVVIPTQTAEPPATLSEPSPSIPTNTATPPPESGASTNDASAEGGGLPGRAPAAQGSSFADLFAAGAKHAEGEGGQGARFDPRAAKAALDALMIDAARCRERGGPTGLTRVVVTFEASGTATNAVVSDPPLAGTTTGNCISAVMKRATIRPFSGQPASVTQRISIQ